MAEENERWGGDELDPEDLKIPEIKLVQAVGGGLAKEEGAKAGDFHASLTGQVYPQGFDMVIVRMGKQRTYWGRTDITDEPPKCASLVVVKGGGQSIWGDDCADCENRLEIAGSLPADERRKKCTIGFNILGLVEGIPFVIRPTGVSAGAAQELYTQLTLHPTLKRQWYRAKTHVTAVTKTTSQGEVFALRFGKLELITDEAQIEANNILAHQLLGAQITQIPETATPEIETPETTLEEVRVPPAQPELTEKVEPAEQVQPAEKTAEQPAAKPDIDMSF